ncbi:hypothetical protein [Sphingobium subterraneum]|uniref:Putative membrane channel-forming protein YqfA (Hemolysin III family) n=1 Tax=Sphingobium subterraneum TaxID=627688 RepID=A0A841IY15_9SPHN|nr:hypothetical protein [Sphingobium subterraneum]MBB6123849.1 putative membrane channel-forming protein YqfA (hemolysin III family) [Sphingobium subterraneum]
MTEILPFLYILVLTLFGWVLSLVRWKRERKWLAAIGSVLGVPALFIIPTLTHPGNEFASLQRAVGITALVWGVVAVALGWGGSVWLRRLRDRTRR